VVQSYLRLCNALDENDDLQDVQVNLNLPEEIMPMISV
jgi:hypothetical protein